MTPGRHPGGCPDPDQSLHRRGDHAGASPSRGRHPSRRDLPQARDHGNHVLPVEAQIRRPGREQVAGAPRTPGGESPPEARGRRSHDRHTDSAGVAPKTMLTPAQRRSWVAWVRDAFQVSSRAAGRATGVWRSLIAYRSRRPPQDALRRRLRELAAARVSYGYLGLHTWLRREGWPVNHKRVYRLYRLDELAVAAQAAPAAPQCRPPRAATRRDAAERNLGDGFHARHVERRPGGAGADP